MRKAGPFGKKAGFWLCFPAALGIGQDEAAVHVFLTPGTHQLQNILQRLTLGGDGVFHPGRHLGIDPAGEKTVRLQLPELVGEGPLGYLGQLPLQLAEALGSVGDEMLQNQRLALAPNHFQSHFHLAGNFYFFRGPSYGENFFTM